MCGGLRHLKIEGVLKPETIGRDRGNKGEHTDTTDLRCILLLLPNDDKRILHRDCGQREVGLG